MFPKHGGVPLAELHRTWLSGVVTIKNWAACHSNNEGTKDIKVLLHLNDALLLQTKQLHQILE